MSYRRRLGPRPPARNKLLAQKTALQLAAITGNLLLLLLKLIINLLKLVLMAAGFIIRLFIKIFIFPLYRLSKRLGLKMAAYQNYWREQFGKNFSRNVIIYGGLSLLAVFTTTTNLKARELRPEDIGRGSGLYSLLASEGDAELYEESAAPAAETTNNEKLGQSQGLQSLGVIDQSQSLPADNNAADAPILAESGDALIKPDLTGTEITPERRTGVISYTVADGDTISEIADKFDISANTILWENKIGPRDFIRPGQKISILPVSGISHVVKRGDSLNAVAARYRAEAGDILEINKLADASSLRVGETIIIPDGIPVPAASARSAPAQRGLASIGAIFKSAPSVAGHYVWPTTSRRISQYFRGWRHTGIDVPNAVGQPIYAADDGVVITAGWNSGGYGLYVVVEHSNGIETLYGHASKIAVERGDRVSKGDVIAAIGSTGRSTGPHVHFEVRNGGNRVNPLDYL